jgi:hypothetical protein
VIERRGAESDEHLAGPGLRIGDVFVAENLRATVFVDSYGFHLVRS